jgi:hypothetical protein
LRVVCGIKSEGGTAALKPVPGNAAYSPRNAMNARLGLWVKKNVAITAPGTENILEGGPIARTGPFHIYP